MSQQSQGVAGGDVGKDTPAAARSVGPGPGRHWAAGRHWVLVYHQGVKVAAVAYEVTG